MRDLEVWSESTGRSNHQQSEFKKLLVDYYDRGVESDPGMIRCMLLDRCVCVRWGLGLRV